MIRLKTRIENYCEYWRFKKHVIPKIKNCINNYVKNVLKKKPGFIPVRMSATCISLREPGNTNLQDGLDTQIDWFDELKIFEDIVNPPSLPLFSFVDNLILTLTARPQTDERRLFSRENFKKYYFYFNYHNSPEASFISNELTRYHALMNYSIISSSIEHITEKNVIRLRSNRSSRSARNSCSATPSEIEKALNNLDKLIEKNNR